VIHAINYSPTWQGFQAVGAFFDSDFANDAFVDLWGRERKGKPDLNPAANTTDGSQGRNDLATIAAEGFNVVRLYNWSPTRQAVKGPFGNFPAPPDSAHWNFLRYAAQLKPNDGASDHLGVIVPVSDYFLSNDQFAWGSSKGYLDPIKNGQVSYDFDAAPAAIQQNLLDFVKSITDPSTGKIFTSVFALSVGNEIDLGGPSQGTPPKDSGIPVGVSAASKLARAEWWMVNLERMILAIPGQTPIGITSPVSTADFGPEGPSSWFQAFVNGVNLGQQVPNATQNPSVPNPNQFAFVEPSNLPPVTGSIPGVATPVPGVPAFEQWYINGYQAYQDPQGYVNILTQYDQGGSSSPYQWPGQKFDVPLLITEMGRSRIDANPQWADNPNRGFAVDLTALGQKSQVAQIFARAEAMETYLTAHKGNTLDMGYSLFEFTDEPTFKKGVESTFGAEMLAETQPTVSIGPSNQFGTYPKSTLLFTAMTEPEKFAGGPLPSRPYRVEKLFPLTSEGHPNGTTLLDLLRTLFRG
jgi:hypothetical protein